ncbi:hypothetical protein AKI39_01780 [Bordetella sp. H567]|nr:hypothetical protein AKI39_01780 [Bordetella sp. H567]
MPTAQSGATAAGLPPAAPFSTDVSLSSDTRPQRAVQQGPIPGVSAPSGGGAATPLRRAAARFVDAFHGLRTWIHDGVGGTGQRSRPARIQISGPIQISDPIPDASGGAGSKFAPARSSELPTYKSADLIAGVADLLRKDKLLDTMVRFSGADITYEKLLYLLEQRWYRIRVDEAGLGFDAPLGGTADSLARRLVSTLRSYEDPWRILASVHDLAVKHPELLVARERYLAYRGEHYPDFAAILERLGAVSADAPVDAIKANIAAKRAESEAQGIPFDVDAYILDNPLDPQAPHPVTAGQLSKDLQRLQQCTPDMARFIEQVDLADCLREYRLREAAGMSVSQS